jgi:hypothetical protein
MKDVQFLRFIKTHRVLAVAVGLVILLSLAIATPLLMSDGTSGYVGVKKEVADSALQSAMTLPGASGRDRVLGGILKVRLDAVQPTVEKTAQNKCAPSDIQSYASYGPEDKEYYAAVISYRTFFGIPVNIFPVFGCIK